MKLFGLMCIFFGCTAVGVYASQKLRQRVEAVGVLLSLLETISAYIRYQSLPLEDVFAAAAENPNFKKLSFLRSLVFSPDISFAEKWTSVLQAEHTLPQQAKQILLRLGNSLGVTDVQGQLSVLQLHRKELASLEEEMREIYRSHGELYRRLGILSGLMLVLLLA